MYSTRQWWWLSGDQDQVWRMQYCFNSALIYFFITHVLLCIIFKADPLLHAAVNFDQLTGSHIVKWKSPDEVGAEAGVWCPGNMTISLFSEGVGLGPCAGVRTPLETSGPQVLPIITPTTCEGPVLSMFPSIIWQVRQSAGASSCGIIDLSWTFISESTRYEDS